MKKFFVSAGLVAIGAAALESAMADEVTGPKYWNVGATLRGFYDDNYNITGAKGKGSFGVEVSPTVSVHVPLQQTDLGLRYTYGAYYYQDRQDAGVNPFDQSHEVDLWVNHAFNERWKAKINDTLAVGQEPELLAGPNIVAGIATPYRVNGNNIANHGNAELDTQWTRLLGTSLSYANNLYLYDFSGTQVTPIGLMTGNINGPSLAGTLNRDEHNIALDLNWTLQPETIVFAGYEFDWYDYTGNEPIAIVVVPKVYTYKSGDRDTRVHKIYLGLSEQFSPNLSATVRAGGSYDDAYADPLFPNANWSPYASISAAYTYLPGCYVQLGFDHDISATDQVAPDSSGHITQYSESSVVYLDVSHRITRKLTGAVIGRVEYDTYQGGLASNNDSTDYGVGVNLNYQFTSHFSMDAGYNYDTVVTDITGYSYSRNRVYLGLTANY